MSQSKFIELIISRLRGLQQQCAELNEGGIHLYYLKLCMSVQESLAEQNEGSNAYVLAEFGSVSGDRALFDPQELSHCT